MKVNGVVVDAAAIGQGLYKIICDKGEEAIVAFGMIPKWAMDMAEAEARSKIIALAASQCQVTVEEFMPYLDKEKLDATVRPIMRQIGTEIYNAAAKAGRMVV